MVKLNAYPYRVVAMDMSDKELVKEYFMRESEAFCRAEQFFDNRRVSVVKIDKTRLRR